MTPRQRGLRRGMWLVVLLALIVGGTLVWATWRGEQPAKQGGAATEAAANGPGGVFQLTDTQGRTVTDATLRGKPYAIFFGFTRCPDVCPTTMNRMALLHKRLGTDADKLSIVFVSVDPEHDKPADIASFLSLFDAPVIGLTGTDEQLKQAEAAFKVYVGRVPLENGDYTIDHTAAIYLMDRNGRFVEPMLASESPEANLDQLRRLIASKS